MRFDISTGRATVLWVAVAVLVVAVIATDFGQDLHGLLEVVGLGGPAAVEGPWRTVDNIF